MTHRGVLRFKFLARNRDEFLIADIVAPAPTPSDLGIINSQYKRNFNVTVRNAKYTNEYNCHGLTFAAKLGWFNDVDRLLAAHDFIRIALSPNMQVDELQPQHEVMRGDVVVYRDGALVTHSGVVWAVKKLHSKMYLTVLSKWGQYSEYFHRHDRVDMNDYGKTIEVWTDRAV